mmetsp:Transcript_69259/g.198640  ORF Transcript_69259/g.198640 Transcript_69259/m.198640 type:complete len:315 (+) Transcript_69259:606-1550(+)
MRAGPAMSCCCGCCCCCCCAEAACNAELCQGNPPTLPIEATAATHGRATAGKPDRACAAGAADTEPAAGTGAAPPAPSGSPNLPATATGPCTPAARADWESLPPATSGGADRVAQTWSRLRCWSCIKSSTRCAASTPWSAPMMKLGSWNWKPANRISSAPGVPPVPSNSRKREPEALTLRCRSEVGLFMTFCNSIASVFKPFATSPLLALSQVNRCKPLPMASKLSRKSPPGTAFATGAATAGATAGTETDTARPETAALAEAAGTPGNVTPGRNAPGPPAASSAVVATATGQPPLVAVDSCGAPAGRINEAKA